LPIIAAWPIGSIAIAMLAWLGGEAGVAAPASPSFANGTAAATGAAATSSCFRVTFDLDTSKD
jgi:hypothetical protein